MDISFTGIKNIGVLSRRVSGLKIKDNKFVLGGDEAVKMDVINIDLSDDVFGKDLSEFLKAINKTDIKSYTNPVNKNFLNIAFISSQWGKIISKIFINKNILRLDDNNLSFLSYLSKLLQRIEKMPERDFHVDKDYLMSDDMKNAFVIGHDISNFYDNFEKFTFDAHDSKNIKSHVKRMSESLYETMVNYFEVRKV